MKRLKFGYLILFIIFVVGTISGQEAVKKAKIPCEDYGQKDFVGKNVTVTVKKIEIGQVLNIFAEKYGCRFVMDKNMGQITLDVEGKEVPWNELLDAILMSQNLEPQILDKSLIRIREANMFSERVFDLSLTNKDKSEPLYTEFIKLNHLIACDSCSHGCTFDKNPSPPPLAKLPKLVSKLLSRRGTVETDSRTNSLIVTDTKKRVASIRKQVEEWDKPNTNLEKILEDFENKNK